MITLIEWNDNEDDNEDENEHVMQNEVVIEKNEVNLKNLKRAKRNWRKCMGCEERANLHRPTKIMRMHFCKSKKIYIEKNDRVCNFHLQHGNWDGMRVATASNFSGKAIDEMVSFILNADFSERQAPHIDAGITESQLKEVLVLLGLPQNPNKAQQKNIESVRLYLERLRHGHTYLEMAHRHNTNRQLISKRVKNGREILLERFVPSHLGYNNCNRDKLLSHTTDMARMLYCNNDHSKCVTIWDGTYIYTCSTANYTHQRKIFSGQKHRHLFKIMKVVGVDGTILDVFGPYPANKNDAEILRLIFEKTGIQNIFRPGDVFLVDRGFRDVVQFLKNKNFDVKIPEFIGKGTNGQLTTLQGNKSRLVTKMRYAIEVANGRMKKKWQLFAKMIPSILTKNLMDDYKIGAALLNAYGKPIICDKDDFINIGQRMMNMM